MTTFTRASATITYTVDIHDAEPMTIGSWTNTLFRPAGAQVTFYGSDVSVKVFGPNVKKDGSDGQNRHDRVLYVRDGLPDWCRALVDELRPGAEAAIR